MDRINQAFLWAKREYFVGDSNQSEADLDIPLSIGFGQTNSQPSTVEIMLEWLEVQQGDKILDIGSGSGWTTALLAFLTGPNGFVYAIEKIPELKKFGESNCRKLKIENVQFFQSGTNLGLPTKYSLLAHKKA